MAKHNKQDGCFNKQDSDWNELLKVMQTPSGNNCKCQIIATSYDSLNNYEHRTNCDNKQSREKKSEDAVCATRLRRIFTSCCTHSGLASRVNDLEFKMKRLEKIYCRRVKKQLDELYGKKTDNRRSSESIIKNQKEADQKRKHDADHNKAAVGSGSSSNESVSAKRSGSRRRSYGSGHINSAEADQKRKHGADHNKAAVGSDADHNKAAVGSGSSSNESVSAKRSGSRRRSYGSGHINSAGSRRRSCGSGHINSAVFDRKRSSDYCNKNYGAEQRRAPGADQKRAHGADKRRAHGADQRRSSGGDQRRSSGGDQRRASGTDQRRPSGVVFRRDSTGSRCSDEAFSDDSAANARKENYFFITTSPSYYDKDQIPVRDVACSSSRLGSGNPLGETQMKTQWMESISHHQRTGSDLMHPYDEEVKKPYRSLKNSFDNEEVEKSSRTLKTSFDNEQVDSRPSEDISNSFVEYTSILKNTKDINPVAANIASFNNASKAFNQQSNVLTGSVVRPVIESFCNQTNENEMKEDTKYDTSIKSPLSEKDVDAVVALEKMQRSVSTCKLPIDINLYLLSKLAKLNSNIEGQKSSISDVGSRFRSNSHLGVSRAVCFDTPSSSSSSLVSVKFSRVTQRRSSYN